MLDALGVLLSGDVLLYLLGGSLMGLIIGILPALGGAAGLSLLIPFIYGMEPLAAMAMVIGMLATVNTGDTVTSVLLGVPGSASSQATVLDGFPMAQKGEAARALSAGFFSSLLGGLFGAVVLTVVLQVAREIILYFGMPEILMLVIFGVASVVALSGRSLAKGLAICAFGMVLASIGFAPATGEQRLDLGLFYLADGLPLVPCVLGAFVVPEIVDLVRRRSAISKSADIGSGQLQGIRDVLANKWLVLRASGIGCLVGAMPGVGGAVVDWIVYGHAMRSAKDRSQFGKGDVRGVISVESSNNAVLGGALLPTLMFGVPGSGSTALLLSALVLIGIQPGPAMLTTNIELTYTMIWSLALANIVGAGVCFLFARQFGRLTQIPFIWIAPFILIAITFATLQTNRDPRDLFLLLAFGILGIAMRRFGFSRPAFLIGFVLQSNLEKSLYQVMQLYDFGAFFTRPLVLVVLAIIVTVVVASLRSQFSSEATFATPEVGQRLLAARKKQLVMPLFLGLAFASALLLLWDLQPLGRVFPSTAAAVGLLAACLVIAQILAGSPSSIEDQEIDSTAPQSGITKPAIWILLLTLLVAGIGFFAGGAVWMATFLLREVKAKSVTVVLSVLLVFGIYLALVLRAGIYLPDGWAFALNPLALL